MVEKITVNPESIRAYGNIITPKTASDFTPPTDYKVVQSTDTVYGTETTVYGIESAYTVSFDSESYTTSDGSVIVQVTVTKGAVAVNNATVTITGGGGGTGTGTTGLNGAANITVTGITESGTLTATYKTAQATAPVTYEQSNYNLTFSQNSYYVDMMISATLSCTLKNGNTSVSGATITFSWEGELGPESYTATTNSNGVATMEVYYSDFSSFPTTVTATYSGVTATCLIEAML